MSPSPHSESTNSWYQRLWSHSLNQASHREKAISALGGFIGILAVLWVSSSVLDQQGAVMLIASMGASAVLLFAVPHGALSQPWPLLGGHLISAFIGVSCAIHIADIYLAAALAVGLSIGAMHYLRCLHPPGGATALVAVLGGESIQQLGYTFLLSPVLFNALVILVVAVLLNLPFAWRRYPRGLSLPVVMDDKAPTASASAQATSPLSHQDLVYAISQLNAFIDVSEEDLVRIYTLALHHSHQPVPCHLHGTVCDEDEENCLCRQLMSTQQ
ncbi:MAG: HPP family protein [Gammaproteobacteria bacterium]|nr:HPP family protein [Gammaproteobacteria bacterium]